LRFPAAGWTAKLQSLDRRVVDRLKTNASPQQHKPLFWGSEKTIKKRDAVGVLMHCWDELTGSLIESAQSRYATFTLEPADDGWELDKEENGE
jgi:hypothetical protein